MYLMKNNINNFPKNILNMSNLLILDISFNPNLQINEEFKKIVEELENQRCQIIF